MNRTCSVCLLPKPAEDFYSPTRSTCKDCAKKKVYARRDALKAKGICTWCLSPVVATGSTLCEECKAKHRTMYYADQEGHKAYSRGRRQRLKLAAFNAYGGPVCTCCGETHIEFLTIDHINNDGAAHRRAMAEERGWNSSSRAMAGAQMYLWLQQNNFPPGFQVLCLNCNHAKGHGGCPHERTRPEHPVLSSPTLAGV